MNYYERRTARATAASRKRQALASATNCDERDAAHQAHRRAIEAIDAEYRDSALNRPLPIGSRALKRRAHIEAQNAEICALLGDVPIEVVLAVTDDPAE
jgi:hypothetical protein